MASVNMESFFITLTESLEICNILSSLNLEKRDQPNSIPTRTEKLLNNTYQVSQSFSTNLLPWNIFFSSEN